MTNVIVSTTKIDEMIDVNEITNEIINSIEIDFRITTTKLNFVVSNLKKSMTKFLTLITTNFLMLKIFNETTILIDVETKN